MTEAPLPDDRLPEEPVDEVRLDEVPAADAPFDEASAERRYPSTIGGAFYLCILVTTAIGIGIVVSGDWRFGVRWIAASLLAAAALRLVLPQRDAGMLAVRHRLVDCFLLGSVGGLLLFLVETIPDQPL